MKSRREFCRDLAVGGTVTVAGCAAPKVNPAGAREYLMYVGTYTGPKSQGIYAYRYASETGTVRSLGLAAESNNPTFLAVHPHGRFLYAANESATWNGKPGGYISAFQIDPATGRLTALNQQSSVGPGPCHLTVDATGRNVLAANYSGGSTVVLPLEANGSLRSHSAFVQNHGSSINPARQKEPHAHSVNLSPDNRFAFVADLGLDEILVFRFDARRGSLAPNDPPYAAVAPGSGPRHFTFHPNGKYAYVINEMLCTITAFRYNAAHGVLTGIQTISTLPVGESLKPEYSTAEIRAHPSGRFLYGSNRGHDTIAVFGIHEDGTLTPTQHVSTQGKTPRNFCLDPGGHFLFAENQGSDTVVTFRVDPASGRLSPSGQVFDVGAPVCIRFAPV